MVAVSPEVLEALPGRAGYGLTEVRHARKPDVPSRPGRFGPTSGRTPARGGGPGVRRPADGEGLKALREADGPGVRRPADGRGAEGATGGGRPPVGAGRRRRETADADRPYSRLSPCRFQVRTSSTTGSSQVPVTVYR